MIILHVLLFSSAVFYFVLVSLKYLIYFQMLPKKNYLVMKSENKIKGRANKITTMN